MERVLIIGNAGSGKTTFSRQLAAKYGLPLVHLDKIFWCGNWEHLGRDAFDKCLQEELEKPRWIIDIDLFIANKLTSIYSLINSYKPVTIFPYSRENMNKEVAAT